jgi:nicotinamide phosphoribosyltransferase
MKAIGAMDADTFNNIIMLTDSYKVTHHLQYPPDTTKIYSYFECRGGAFPEVCFFGLQYFLKKYMVGNVVTKEKIDQAEAYLKIHLSHPTWGYDEKLFNRKSWEYILEKYGGKLPVSIKAVPEGTVLPYKNVLFTMENTDDKCYWLTNYLETLLVQIWYPTTVCTQSREQKKIIMKYLTKTGSEDVIKNGLHLFKLHDFGFRGVSSVESAATGGAGHLVNFMGTDTMAALMCVKEYYGTDASGFSIPASEHSTMTSWGREKEVDAMRNMLDQYPKGLVACVSDSYDIFKACEQYWGTDLKDKIMSRDGCLVVRPDSGEIPKIVLDVLEKLGSKFPTSMTSTQHKLLPPQIRVIQGDGIDINTLEMILKAMDDAGWAADNLAFGSGGALLQKLHRDTQKCAFKCSYACINGQDVDVVKDPITDPGKKSKKGRLTLEKKDGTWTTVTEGKGDQALDQLKTVFKDGKVFVNEDFAKIRDRAAAEL